MPLQLVPNNIIDNQRHAYKICPAHPTAQFPDTVAAVPAGQERPPVIELVTDGPVIEPQIPAVPFL